VNALLNVVVLHRIPGPGNDPFAVWERCCPRADTLALFGGPPPEFERLPHHPRILAPGERIRTVDHQRQLRNPLEAYGALRAWLRDKPYDLLHIADYDLLPLRADYFDLLLRRRDAEDADLLVFSAARVDGTSNPMYLGQCGDPRFHAFFRSVSVRENKAVVLNVLGAGMLWTREAFAAVSALDEPFPMHGEEYLPTLAHHLGFRVRAIPDQSQFAYALTARPESARRAGAWVLHPVKAWEGDWRLSRSAD
jgi:hypothetical protein